MKTMFCPACGLKCKVTSRQDLEHDLICPNGHKWAALINLNDGGSADGTSIISFQCDGTSVNHLPDEEKAATIFQ